jgi:ketosteroid isomerase-like protein
VGRLYEIMQAADAASRGKDWDALASLHTEDVTSWTPTYEVVGRDALMGEAKAQNGPLEDIRTESTLVAETEDTVVAEWTWSIPHPSGVGRASLRGLSYLVFEGDRIRKTRQYWDPTEFMRQLEAGAGIE